MPVRGVFWSTLRRFFQFGRPMVVGLTGTFPVRGTRLGRFLAFPPPIRCSFGATPEVFIPTPPFFVHSVHFAVPIRLRAILPDALAQFRGVFLKPCRTDRGWWVGRRADEPALARSTRPGKTPQPPIRSTRAVFSCNPD